MASITVLTGPPGAGKSTVGRLIARGWPLAIHMHTDDFYAWIVSGYIPPWTPESRHQNTVVMEAIAGTAARYSQGGYDVVVDGIVGPWFLDPWWDLGLPVHYVVLRPSLEAAEHRARTRGEHALKDLSVVATMHAAFGDLGPLEGHVIESTALSPDETAAEVRRRISDGSLILRRGDDVMG